MTSAYLERPLRSFAQALADLAHQREAMASSDLSLEQQHTARQNDDVAEAARMADLARHPIGNRRAAPPT